VSASKAAPLILDKLDLPTLASMSLGALDGSMLPRTRYRWTPAGLTKDETDALITAISGFLSEDH
jgi:hypothetical protein